MSDFSVEPFRICQACGKQDASVHLTYIQEGSVVEEHVCQSCADGHVRVPKSRARPTSTSATPAGWLPGANVLTWGIYVKKLPASDSPVITVVHEPTRTAVMLDQSGVRDPKQKRSDLDTIVFALRLLASFLSRRASQ